MPEKIFLSSPHMCGKEIEYVQEAFDTNWLAPLGPHVNAFEQEIAEYARVKSAAALSSGTAAIHLALKCLGVSKGDVVFCSALTFAATCNPIVYEGAIPVFIDSEPETWNMSPNAMEKAFKDYIPKAVLVVNLYGQSADMDPIKTICDKHNVPIVEDAAESLGADYKGRKSGSIGDLGIYSFNGNKIITTSGGGMLVSNNEDYIKKARFWATQAREPVRYYQHKELGYNYRMSNVCAAIGRGQLTVLNERVKQKKLVFEKYKRDLADIFDIQMMPISSDGQSNYWLSCALINETSKIKPMDIILALEKENIESRHIWKPMQLQPYWKKYDFYEHYDNAVVSISEDIFNRGVCLPSDTKMTNADQNRVIDIIKGLWV